MLWHGRRQKVQVYTMERREEQNIDIIAIHQDL